jgi:cellulose synthase (UDP-forming)
VTTDQGCHTVPGLVLPVPRPAPADPRVVDAPPDPRTVGLAGEYREAAYATGPFVPAGARPSVKYRVTATRRDLLVLTALVAVNTAIVAVLVTWLLQPGHIPAPGQVGLVGPAVALGRLSLCVVVAIELLRFCQNIVLWVLVYRMRDPLPMAPPRGLRVAMLTTIVPDSEPVELVERALRAMLQVRYEGHVDVWILDEGDSPAVRAMADRLGVRHFSRKGRGAYNQPSGAYRARSKAGNHNAWRTEHAAGYDVVCQMDPDHVPFPCFLERTLGYFRDPETAFVVAPQVYGNPHDGFVPRGASVQQYVFSGVVSRAGNGLNAPLLIGTNHLYRPAAWDQIGGYQDSVTEDHLTGMRVLGTVNPATGRAWRAVYTPDVLAIGEAPTTWTDYFNQQKRWAYGICEIKRNRRLRTGIRLTRAQRLLFGAVQFYYPSVAVHIGLSSLATAGYLLLDAHPARLDGRVWVGLWAAAMLSWYVAWLWLRRFNLAPHERRDPGLHGIALAMIAGPVYVVAAIAAALRRPLTYIVTAKGRLRRADTLRTFRLHLCWAGGWLGVLAAGLLVRPGHAAVGLWAALSLAIGLAPPLAVLAGRLRARLADRAASPGRR